MPSNNECAFAKSLSDLRDELRSGLSLFKRELVEDSNSVVKRLKSTASSSPKCKKKGNEQFEIKSQVLDHVQSASSYLAATPPQVEKDLEELKEG